MEPQNSQPQEPADTEQNFSPISVTDPIQTSRSKTKVLIMIIIVGLFLILSVGVGAFFMGRNTGKLPIKIPQISITPLIVKNTPTISTADNNMELHTSAENNYSISYPNTWTKRVITVKKGERLQEGPHDYKIRTDDTGEEVTHTEYDIDINAEKADTEYLILSKDNNWQIHIQAQKVAVEKGCDFQTESGADTFHQEIYKELPVGNLMLLRHSFETGWIWTSAGPAGAENIPQSQVIFNKREAMNALNRPVIYLDGCIFNNDVPLLLQISYFSPFFTYVNFPEDKMGKVKPINIDSEILKEMDKIVETITF